MSSQRRFARILASVLATACSAPRPPAAQTPREPVVEIAPVDAGVAETSSVDAVAPAVASAADPLVDRNMLPAGQPVMLAPFRFVEGEWPKISPQALPSGLTYVAEVRAKKVVRESGGAPAEADVARALEERERARAADEPLYVELVWVNDGRVVAGSTSQLRRALAPIDTAEKAILLLEWGHRRSLEWQPPGGKACVGCTGRFVRRARSGDAFEVVGMETLHRPGPCPHSNFEAYPALVVYEVSPDGRVRRTAQDVSPWPQPKVSTRTAPCVGRDTEGSGRTFVDARSLGDHLAQLAHDEAVSVASFDRLARELASAGAPRVLVGRAQRAARDERRHARTMARLAEEHGGSVRFGAARPLPARPIAVWAVENAIEGCAGETYGALVAAYQARHVGDERTRRALARIARDEAEHARLAWDVHAWALSTGGAALSSELSRAMVRAYDDLEAHVRARPEHEPFAGWTPPRGVALAMVEGLRASLAA